MVVDAVVDAFTLTIYTPDQILEMYFGGFAGFANEHRLLAEERFWNSFDDIKYIDDLHIHTKGNVIRQGEIMERNWFIAIHAVYVESKKSSPDEIYEFAGFLFRATTTETETGRRVYEPLPCPETGEALPPYTIVNISKTLTVEHVSPERMMEQLNFNAEQKEWAELLYHIVSEISMETDRLLLEGVSLGNPLPIKWRSAVTSEYGPRIDPIDGSADFHTGIDLKAPEGTDIMVALDGVVVTVVFNDTGYGNHVKINHGNGIETLYGHCSAIFVVEEQEVEQGEVVAAVGNTGKSTGDHLHFELRINGKTVNPRPYLP